MERSDNYGTSIVDPAVATVAHTDIINAGAEHDLDSNSNEKISNHDEKTAPSLEEKSALPYKEAVTDFEDRQEAFTAEDLAAGIPFPESSLPAEDGDGLTVRALVVGTCLGLVIAASNIYLGLKTGFTFGASLFASLLGFIIIKAIGRTLPTKLGGGFFGPKENVTIQSAATGAAGLTSMFVAAVPAMYRNNLLGASPQADFGRLFTFTFCSAFYACFFAIPLRRFYILRQKLIFPTPTATALAIRAMHTANGAALARKKTKALGIAFVGALVYVVLQGFAPGILQDQHIFYWFASWGWSSAQYVDSWGWFTTITPAFFGSGMLAGPNASLSFLGGLFIAYGFVGPVLTRTGEAACRVYNTIEDYASAPNEAYTCFSLSSVNTADLKTASPRYWMIWPAVLMMLIYSFTELFMNWKPIYYGIRAGLLSLLSKVTKREYDMKTGEEIPDPAPSNQQVRGIWIWGGLLASIVMTILVCSLQFHMNAGNVILAVILAFLFSFIGIQSSGTTDINPLSSVAKASQLIIGGVVKGQGVTGDAAMLQNLLGGSIASSAAAHAVDMVGDLKTGHWVRASPRSQFWAQLFGSLFATPFSVGLYVLFVNAYPCINDANIEVCAFGAPSVAAWSAVANAVVSPTLPITLSSGLTAIILSVVAALTIVAKYWWIPAKYHKYLPNWNAVGIGFLVPNNNYGISMATGAIFCWAWAKKYPKSADIFAYAIAAGLVAGEGIAGVINAILQIAGVPQSKYGSTVGLAPWM